MKKPDARKVFVIQFIGGWKPREVRVLAEDVEEARQSARLFKKSWERIGQVTEESANA